MDSDVVGPVLAILIVAVSVVSIAVVGIAFVWAARKDGEEDRALQKRLGIRRKTRLGR
jgi:type II secretory pathway pseudopilin PulG